MKISDAVSECKEALKLVRENQRGLGARMKKLEDNQKAIISLITSFKKATFTIKGSEFEAQFKQETANLFCKDLRRSPSQTQINEVIVSVLKEEARNKHKYDIAKSWVLNKLTDLRSEERKRMLGQGNLEKLAKLDMDELAEAFMKTMGASDSESLIDTYVRNLALLRKFCCVVGKVKASENTYKSFREWIEATYKDGEPDEDQWMEIIDQDIHSNFNAGRWGSRDMQLDPATEDDDALTESPRHWTKD